MQQIGAVAELERGLISERTKAEYAAAKARGVKLGTPHDWVMTGTQMTL